MDKRQTLRTRIIGIFRTPQHAEQAAKLLEKKGFSRDQITLSTVEDDKVPFSSADLHDFTFKSELEDFFHSAFDDFDKEKLEEACLELLDERRHMVSVNAHNAEDIARANEIVSEFYGSSQRKNTGPTSRQAMAADLKEDRQESAVRHTPGPMQFVDIFPEPDKE